MRRLLTVTMALGLVITAMNFTGIFAVFTDRATTGTNSAESGAQARVADLQIATPLPGTGNCDGAAYVDDLETGVVSTTDLQPGGASGFMALCVRNHGSAALDLSVKAIDVEDTETGCTGDEAAAGDATCGTAAVGDGELSGVLLGNVGRIDCATQASVVAISPLFSSLASDGAAIGTLDPGEAACIYVSVQMLVAGQAGATLADIQQAQSDKVEWKYAFDGAPS
ncbi:MAG TPA: hypothetical protein VHL56_07510 [Candidatus Limnocylindrales bacterium]|nr:hypothetical protein [Candidatus Limnocylindrales bacterium]